MYNKVPYLCFCAEMSNNEENLKKKVFYDDDLGTEIFFFSVCLISKYSSVTINVYLYSVHLGIRNVTGVFHFPFKAMMNEYLTSGNVE